MENKTDRTITAIIPARKETHRLKDKNTLPFGDSTLLERKIGQLKGVTSLDQIVVSSEDDTILDIARNNGVTPLKRPYEYASSACPFGRFVEYICTQVQSETVLWACCTSPFIETDDYTDAISQYYSCIADGYDSLITVQQLHRFIIDQNGPVNYQRGLRHKNSSQLDGLYIFTNGIVIAPRKKMIEWKYTWGNIPYMIEVDKKKGIDISDRYDYNIARYLLKKQEDKFETK